MLRGETRTDIPGDICADLSLPEGRERTTSPTVPISTARTHCARLLAAGLLLAAVPAWAATITVNIATDEDVDNASCSLREAITAANNDADYNGCVGAAAYGTDTIVFAIPGAGPHIISVATALPDITTPLHIYGYSQPGASLNDTPVGTNADIRVGIANGGSVSFGLVFRAGASNSSARGLRITGFSGSGVLLDGTGGLAHVTIAGNFIGTDGTLDLGNNISGILVQDGVTDSTIGGNTPEEYNLISGNGNDGIVIGGVTTTYISILNNLIGTTASGNDRLPNGQRGIWFNGGGNYTVDGNVIGADDLGAGYGIVMRTGTSGISIIRNSIGVGADGSSDIGGSGHGVWLQGANENNHIGNANAANGNIIANWGGDGVRVDRTNLASPYSTDNRIRGNRIFNNGGLGIELADTAGGSGTGATANDADDVDDGPNGFQNFPVITAATTDGATTSVVFALDGPGSPNLGVEVFSSPSCDASGHGEGEVFLGGAYYDAPGGDVIATLTALPATTVGHFITMTATNFTTGDTSEFSACQVISATGGGGVEIDDGSVRAVPLLGPGGLALLSLALALAGGLARRR